MATSFLILNSELVDRLLFSGRGKASSLAAPKLYLST